MVLSLCAHTPGEIQYRLLPGLGELLPGPRGVELSPFLVYLILKQIPLFVNKCKFAKGVLAVLGD